MSEPAGSGRQAFTMIELMVVVSIIAILVAILLPTIGVLRDRSRKADAMGMVTALSMAVESYAAEDQRRRHPDADASDALVPGCRFLLWTETDGNQPRGPLDLLALVGYDPRSGTLVDVPGTTRRLHIDPWHRGFRYYRDPHVFPTTISTTPPVASRPDAGIIQPDWNPRNQWPFAYLWSLGKPTGAGEIVDSGTDHASHWLYRSGGR